MTRVKPPRSATCERCGGSFDIEKRHRPVSNPGLYCSRTCAVKARKAHGGYQELSKLGNAAQSAIKQKTGKVPGKRGGARLHRKQQQD